MRIEQIMTRNLRTCQPEDSLNTAAQIMWEQDCGCVPVVRPGDGDAPELVGMLTDRDVCMAAYTQGRNLCELNVATAMAHGLCSCRPTDSLDTALTVLRTNQLRRLPVVDEENHLVGLLSLADLVREAARERGQWTKAVSALDVGEALEGICRPRNGPGDLVAAA